MFQIRGLSASLVLHVQCGRSARICRVWPESLAPPAARDGILFISGTVVRGQQIQNGIGVGFFNGVLTDTMVNPWVVGGVMAAAVAAPIVILEDNDDAS